jgi:hypothetical protein
MKEQLNGLNSFAAISITYSCDKCMNEMNHNDDAATIRDEMDGAFWASQKRRWEEEFKG